MIMKKRVVSLFSMAFMMIIVVGCSSGLTLEEVITKSQEHFDNAESMDVRIAIALNMETSDGDAFDMAIEMDMAIFTDPLKSRTMMTTDIGGFPLNTELYMISDDNTFSTYTHMQGMWMKQEMDRALFEAAMQGNDISVYLEVISDLAENFELEATTRNGSPSYRVAGVVSGEAMASIMETVQGLDELGISLDALPDWSELDGFSMTIYIDQDSLAIELITIDLTDMMASLMGIMMAEMGVDEKLKIHTYTIEIEYLSFNSSTPFQLPEAARDAVVLPSW